MTTRPWKDLKFWKSPTYQEIQHTLVEIDRSLSVRPPRSLWFRALELTSFKDVKCVILGQDPYPTEGYAHGLAFSVLPWVTRLPPSLCHILAEYRRDLGYGKPPNGCLYTWATRGVLLWNTVLTVELGNAGSHIGKMGWEKLTIEIIQKLSKEKEEPIVFILWGKKAQEYRSLINHEKHLVIEASHPSPLSARKGFIGHKPFSKTNEFLGNERAIDWRL